MLGWDGLFWVGVWFVLGWLGVVYTVFWVGCLAGVVGLVLGGWGLMLVGCGGVCMALFCGDLWVIV